MQNTAGHRPSPFFQRLAAFAGIVAVALGIFGTLGLGFLKPGYNLVHFTISELGESGGVNSTAARIVFILIGAGEIVFAAGLSARSRPRKLALIGSICLAANGLLDYVGSGLFPMDAGDTYDSVYGQIHFILSLAGMAAMVLPAFFYWRVFAAEDRSPERGASLAAAVFIVLGAILFSIAFFTGPYVGLAQRFLDWVYLAWIFFLALGLLRGDGKKSEA